MRSLASEYRVIAIDVPGMSSSAVSEDYKSFSTRDVANGISELLDALRLESVHFAGLSAGSTIITQFALMFPEKVLSLAFFSMPTLFKEACYISSEERELVEFLIPSTEKGVSELISYLFFKPPVIPAFFQRKFLKSNIRDRQLKISVLRSIMMSNTQLVPRLLRLAAPCLLIYGDHDKALPEQSVQYMCNAIKGLCHHKLENVGHFALIEEPEESSWIYKSFLKYHT